MRYLWTVGLAAGLGLWGPGADAMDWTVKREPGLLSTSGDLITVRGEGEIAVGDAAALFETIQGLLDEAAAGEPAPVPYVELQSPGGNVAAGIEIGFVLRAFDLPVHVPPGPGCHSACTVAFLGGTKRTVAGPFGIHAMSLDTDWAANAGVEIQTAYKLAQNNSSVLVSYARDMIGRADLVEEMLKILDADTVLVDDASLRDWHVITEALRPSQRLPDTGGARCLDNAWLGENVRPRYLVCNDLAIARQFAEIADMVETLRGRPFAPEIDAEQARFEKSWEACNGTQDQPHLVVRNGQLLRLDDPNPSLQDWVADTLACVTDAVGSRWQELDGLVRYYQAVESEPAKGWK